MAETHILWLTTAMGENYINPTNIGILTNFTVNFMESNLDNCAVLIDGIEYLSVYNEFNSVLKSLYFINEVAMKNGAIVIIPVVPQAFGENKPVDIYVTGESAFILDFNITTSDYTPWIMAFVLALSFIILLLAFRSLVISFTAIIMNLLSVGAAYGLVVLVFQKGFGVYFFGFQQVEFIETWLPLFLFALLFGLSMDYQVFLVSRVRERYM